MARLDAARVALLGTLRRDGSPGISPIQPCIAEGQLLIGAMTWLAKASDCGGSAVCAAQRGHQPTGEEELKLYGSAAEAGQDFATRRPCVVAGMGAGRRS